MENYFVEELVFVVGGWLFIIDDEGYLIFCVFCWGGNENIFFIVIGEDYGDFVYGVLIQFEKYNGKFVYGMSYEVIVLEFVEIFDKGQ